MKVKEEITHLIDTRITEIIRMLKDQNFGSKDQRQVFVKLIAALAVSKDPRAKKTIKKLGDILSTMGDDLLKESQKNSLIKEYKSVFIENKSIKV